MSQNGNNSNESNNSQDSHLNKAKITGDNINALIEKIGGVTGKIDELITEMKTTNKNIGSMKIDVNNAVTSMGNAVTSMDSAVTSLDNAVQAMNQNVTNSINSMKDAIEAIYALINFKKNKGQNAKKENK